MINTNYKQELIKSRDLISRHLDDIENFLYLLDAFKETLVTNKEV